MFCEKCGTKNDSSNKFCEKCGSELNNEVKKTKTASENKNTPDIKNKLSTLSKKQKLIGGIALAVIVVLIALYVVASKLTSLETMGDKVYKELAKDQTISDKYLSTSLSGDEYFVSLKDIIKDEEIKFDEDDYTIKTTNRKITVKYSEDDEKYKIIFNVKKDGKSLVLFDKYVINKVTIEKDGKDISLYDPKNMQKITITAVKDSKITINNKEVPKSCLDSKKSKKKNDVYVVKGVPTGYINVKFSFGKLAFEREVYVSKSLKNEFDLTDYISSYYLVDDGEDYAKVFKKYIETYYEYVNDESKSINDFNKKYKVTDDIKEKFADAKEDASRLESFEITDVELSSLYYDSYDQELDVRYKVNYSYKLVDSESEKKSYDTVKVTYNLKDAELPIDLDYMPY